MNFTILTHAAEVQALIRWHNSNSEYVVLDTETTDKNPRKAQLIDIQMSAKDGNSAVLFSGEHIHLLGELRPLQVWHNYKYDWKVLYLHGLDMRSKPMRDTMLMHHLVDENADHDLDSIVKEKWKDDYKAKFWAKYKSYQEATSEDRLDYGCRDIVYTGRLYQSLWDDIDRQGVPAFMLDHVHRLALALYDTELAGIRVDLPYLMKMGGELKRDIVGTEEKLRALGGVHCDILEHRYWARAVDKAWTPRGEKWKSIEKQPFNWVSSPQIQDLLYGQLKLPVQKHPKTKQPTADDKALEKLGDAHPILPELRKLRKYSKMHGAFIEGVLDRAEGERVYPSFNVNGTVTGRISHSDPNMGQIPSKDEWSKIRGIFIPEPGNKLITCDYAQLEICLAAHFSNDPLLLDLVHSGRSMHDTTTAELQDYGVTRGAAKAINFGMIYGALEHKVAQIVGCSLEKAKQILERFWGLYPGLKKAIFEAHRHVDEGLPIINPFGRHRRFPKSFRSEWERAAAKRQAFNSLVQGTGADLTSRAFYLVSERLKASGRGRGIMTIHDELVIEVKESFVSEERTNLAATMIECGREINLRVPLSVSCSEGLERWEK